MVDHLEMRNAYLKAANHSSLTTKVFIHGNPETSAIWNPLIEELKDLGIDNIICLAPPGFGSDYPKDFIPNRRNYINWLLNELRSINAPIDIVAHDWGAGHLFGVLAEYPNIVRTWIADSVGMLHPSYQWHAAAQSWQNRDYQSSLNAINMLFKLDPQSFSKVLSAVGMNKDIALEIKEHANDLMAHSAVSLYKDAIQPKMKILGELVIKAKPPRGLVIAPEYDDYSGDISTYKEIADALDADYITLEGCGHWWMNEKPKITAQVLITHWSKSDI